LYALLCLESVKEKKKTQTSANQRVSTWNPIDRSIHPGKKIINTSILNDNKKTQEAPGTTWRVDFITTAAGNKMLRARYQTRFPFSKDNL
jgi:hypothetical protein